MELGRVPKWSCTVIESGPRNVEHSHCKSSSSVQEWNLIFNLISRFFRMADEMHLLS
jgi:hypothetical protein